MKIDLEKYIRNHRSELDDVEEFHADEMWKEFAERDKLASPPKFKWYKMAAVGIILVAAVFTLVLNWPSSQDDLIYAKLSQSDPELALEQEALVKFISNQGQRIEEMGIDKKQFPELFQELRVLDSLQLEAISNAKNYQDRKNIYKALLKNYEGKARVLELIIIEFDTKENENNYEKAIQI